MTTTVAARHRMVACLGVVAMLAWLLPTAAAAQATTDRDGSERIAESRLFDRHNLARTQPGVYGQAATPAAPAFLWAEDVAIAARAWSDAMAASGQRPAPDLANRVCCEVEVSQNIASVAGVPSAVYPDYEAAADRVVEMIMAAALPRGRLMDADAIHVGIGATVDAAGKLWVAAFYRQPDGTAPPGSTTYPHPLPTSEPAPPEPPQVPQPAPTEEPDADPPMQDIGHACPADVPRSRFTDVTREAAERAVSCLVWWGIASGTSPTTFDPHREVRRDQMASFVARAIERSGGTLPAADRQLYPDVPHSLAHSGAVNRLAAAGILTGRDGRYHPGESLSRGEMARTLVRAYEYRANQSRTAPSRQWFSDVRGTPHERPINQAADAGWAAGIGDGTFRPDGGVRRDQMALFLARWLQTLIEEGLGSPPA